MAQSILITPQDVGKLLEDVITLYLKQANPSAFLRRVELGIREFTHDQQIDSDTRLLASDLARDIAKLRTLYQAQEASEVEHPT